MPYERKLQKGAEKLHNFYSQMKAVDRRLHVSCMGEERNKNFTQKNVKGRDRMEDFYKEEESIKVDRHDM